MRTWAEGLAYAIMLSQDGVDIGVGNCKLRAREAFEIPSNGTHSAARSWELAPDQHPTSNPGAIPDNVFVWWTGGGSGFGHVAIHTTGGRLLSPGTPAKPGRWDWTTFAGMWSNLRLVGWTHSIDGRTPARPATPAPTPLKPKPKPKPKRKARIVLCNLHATSNPAIVVPWLIAQCLAHRVDAVLLSECTRRHARVLRALPLWRLIKSPKGDEAILIRRKLASNRAVFSTLTKTWMGKHTGKAHKPRTLPTVTARGWLPLVSVHFPPGWVDGPDDRQSAGVEYRAALGKVAETIKGPLLLGGDWNARALAKVLTGWRAQADLKRVGTGIDHIAFRGCEVTERKALGRARGMDHGAWLYEVEEQ